MLLPQSLIYESKPLFTRTNIYTIHIDKIGTENNCTNVHPTKTQTWEPNRTAINWIMHLVKLTKNMKG